MSENYPNANQPGGPQNPPGQPGPGGPGQPPQGQPQPGQQPGQAPGQPPQGPGPQQPGPQQPQGQPGPGHPGPGQPGPGGPQPGGNPQQAPGFGPGTPSAPSGPEGPGFGGPGGPGYPGPGGPGGPGGPEEGKGGNKGLIIGAIAGVVVLLGGAVLALVLLLGGNGDAEAGGDGEGEGEDGESAVDPSADEAPDTLVEAYLTALSEGDAETALGFIDDAPNDTTFMSDEVVEHANEVAPLSNIEVSEVGEVDDHAYSEDVTVDFTIGDGEDAESISTRVATYSNDDGTWSLSSTEVVASITEPSSLGSLDMTINGEPVTHGDAEVFWGLAYEFGFEQENFTFTGGANPAAGASATMDDDEEEPEEDDEDASDDDEGGDDAGPDPREGNVIYVTDTYVSLSDLSIELTAEAEDTWRQLVRDAVDECVESNDLEAGCGLDLPDEIQGDEVVEGSVERSLPSDTQDELENLEPELDYSNPHQVSASYFTGSVDVEYDVLINGEEIPAELISGDPGWLDTPVVDMTEEDPTVEWE